MDKPAEKNPPHPPGLQAPGGCFIIYDTGLCVPIPPEPLRLLEAAPKARKDGCLMQKNQNVVLFYVRVLLYCLVALLIRAAALAPLAALFVFPADSLWRWLWVVSPLMVLFLVLPLRFSFADALVQRPRTRDFSIDRALSLRQYGEKLAESLRHALSVLKWAIPLAGLGAWGYYLKEQYTVKGLLDGLRELGKNVSGTWYAVVNFFRGLFGHLPLETVEGSYMQGVYTVLTLVGLGLLILLYGAVRNSATRYIWAVANHEDRPVRREIRRRLRGRRMAQLGTALCNLLLCVPFLWLAGLQLKDTFLELCQQLVLAMSWNGRPQISPDVVKTLLPLTLTFFLTYMPLLPARRILTAAFAVREPRHTAPRNGQPVEEDPTLPKAIVPDWVRAENEENGASDRSADA